MAHVRSADSQGAVLEVHEGVGKRKRLVLVHKGDAQRGIVRVEPGALDAAQGVRVEGVLRGHGLDVGSKVPSGAVVGDQRVEGTEA